MIMLDMTGNVLGIVWKVDEVRFSVNGECPGVDMSTLWEEADLFQVAEASGLPGWGQKS
jgi:hypothetical protein